MWDDVLAGRTEASVVAGECRGGLRGGVTVAELVRLREFPLKNGRVITLHRGDCVTELKDVASRNVDVVVTSPPYNIGVTYSLYVDTIPRQNYLDWTGIWLRAVKRVMAPGASLFLNVGSKPTDPWVAMDVAREARRFFTLQNTIHWIKAISLDTDNGCVSYGHYKPINSGRFVNDCHEFIFHFTLDGRVPLDRKALGVPYKDSSNTTRWNNGGDGMRCRGNTWFVPYDTIKSRATERPHPATFPLRLPEWCLRLHGLDRIRTVLDPFLGLGSTAVACARLGLDCIGIELDQEYFSLACERVRREVRCAGETRESGGAVAVRGG